MLANRQTSQRLRKSPLPLSNLTDACNPSGVKPRTKAGSSPKEILSNLSSTPRTQAHREVNAIASVTTPAFRRQPWKEVVHGVRRTTALGRYPENAITSVSCDRFQSTRCTKPGFRTSRAGFVRLKALAPWSLLFVTWCSTNPVYGDHHDRKSDSQTDE